MRETMPMQPDSEDVLIKKSQSKKVPERQNLERELEDDAKLARLNAKQPVREAIDTLAKSGMLDKGLRRVMLEYANEQGRIAEVEYRNRHSGVSVEEMNERVTFLSSKLKEIMDDKTLSFFLTGSFRDMLRLLDGLNTQKVDLVMDLKGQETYGYNHWDKKSIHDLVSQICEKVGGKDQIISFLKVGLNSCPNGSWEHASAKLFFKLLDTI